MRVNLFSWDANPSIDKAYRVNERYAEEHVTAGRAEKRDGFYQMFPPELPPRERTDMPGSMDDWHTQHVSMTPVGPLRVTTFQLAGV